MTIKQGLINNILDYACEIITYVNRIKKRKDLEFIDDKMNWVVIEMYNILNKESEKNERKNKKH